MINEILKETSQLKQCAKTKDEKEIKQNWRTHPKIQGSYQQDARRINIFSFSP